MSEPVTHPDDAAAATNADLLPAGDDELSLVGSQVGPYAVVRVLGRGGMGAVYLAEQQEPIRRRVALKVVRFGLETKQVLARFDAERQSLALMTHPGIAQVLDAGMTGTGRPFFVMEYVAGQPLTEYCDERRLAARARLELFIDVCAGVQHAHQKGIIHRDLKPTNILVAETDGRPQPKVIDFGIAKAVRGRLTEMTLVTQLGLPMGTPEYMSPEQAEMSEADVDTTTDIYSLGVILYELLTGTLPHDPKALKAAGLTGFARVLREAEPERPSSRVSGLGHTASTVADRRHTDAPSLRRQLEGDLDWIVLKAMEKERARRYASASELAEDIRHFLRNEPVSAGPPGAAYRARKFVARHRALVGATAASVAVLLLGILGTTLGLLRARRAETEAQAQRAAALTEARKATAVSQFLKDMLASADPHNAGREVRVADVLRRAAQKVETAYPGDPLLEAAVRDTIGTTFASLGELPEAETQIRTALDIRQRTLGGEHPDTLASKNSLLEWLQGAGRSREALGLGQETLAARRRVLGSDHPDTLTTMNDVAIVLFQTGKATDAIALMHECVDTRRRTLGEEHAKTLLAEGNLAAMFEQEHRLDEAESLLRSTLLVEERALGPEHPTTLFALKSLASVLHDQKKLAEAEPLMRRALAISSRVSGPNHVDTLVMGNDLGLLLMDAGRLDESAVVFAGVVKGAEEGLPAGHRFTAVFRRNGGRVLLRLERYPEAERQLLRAQADLHAAVGDEHNDTRAAVRRLVELYEAWGKPAEAGVWKKQLPPA